MKSLEQLTEWALFREADGFVTLHFTDSGVVQLGCGKEVGVPSDFIRCMHHDLDCGCPETGWIAEFKAGAIKEGATFPGEHFKHYWAFGLTMEAACDELVARIKTDERCACSVDATTHGDIDAGSHCTEGSDGHHD